ncbi:unnamed protein product [Clonostachys rosea]|uniref:Uncharacterized protein n=1 Tax=Bionectria ochroleuca TaxID=29856 RepID=A0ABY6V373_BIOOC|nr:unnamed protein product [Clonostachys rosea]
MTQVFIPGQQLKLIIQLVECLKARWLEVCQKGQHRLQEWRQKALKKSGDDPELLKCLLLDAEKWVAVRELLQQHANATIQFGQKYNLRSSTWSPLRRLDNPSQCLEA